MRLKDDVPLRLPENFDSCTEPWTQSLSRANARAKVSGSKTSSTAILPGGGFPTDGSSWEVLSDIEAAVREVLELEIQKTVDDRAVSISTSASVPNTTSTITSTTTSTTFPETIPMAASTGQFEEHGDADTGKAWVTLDQLTTAQFRYVGRLRDVM